MNSKNVREKENEVMETESYGEFKEKMERLRGSYEERGETKVAGKWKDLYVSKSDIKGKRIRSYKMTPHREAVFRVKKECKKNKIEVFSSGWPDLLLVKNNKVWFLEIKTGKLGRLSYVQNRVREVLVGAGINYVVFRSHKERVEDIIEEIGRRE